MWKVVLQSPLITILCWKMGATIIAENVYRPSVHPKPTTHRLTYPKGVHSFRYFLHPMFTPNLLIKCISMLWQSPRGNRWLTHWASMLRWKWYSPSQVLTAKHVSYPQLTATHVYAWAGSKSIGEVAEWVYAFQWVCKPVNRYMYSVYNFTFPFSLSDLYEQSMKRPPRQAARVQSIWWCTRIWSRIQ